MFIKQLYTGCLSEAAYYIESEGEAAIIDPLRDIDVYLELSRERAEAVKQYLVDKYGFPATRMRAAGNGPDRPLADNSTPEGREKNRRTDIKVYPNPGA